MCIVARSLLFEGFTHRNCLLSQDEREVKKLRRKQSNRESARRSRLRKQAECEALSGKVKDLQRENSKLKTANKALEDRVEALARLLEQARTASSQLTNDEIYTLINKG